MSQRVTGLMLIALLGSPSAMSAAARQRAVVVVVHKENRRDLSREELKAAFLKQISAWKSGERVRPVETEGDSAAKAAFYQQLLAMSPDDVERHWLQIRYARAEAPPKRVEDDQGVIKFVSTFKGAIGFVDAATVSEEALEKVASALTLPY